jgi:hypothetical protein
VHEGDVFAGLQSVLFAGDESRPTVSISYVRRVHTSVAPELDVGTFRQSTSILLSEDIKTFHFDTKSWNPTVSLPQFSFSFFLARSLWIRVAGV